jgi:excisionase family DNA binding protein
LTYRDTGRPSYGNRAVSDDERVPMPPNAAPDSSTPDDLVARREIWPIREAAYRLGISTKTLYRERERGRIELVRVGGRAYVTNRELRRYVAALEAGA